MLEEELKRITKISDEEAQEEARNFVNSLPDNPDIKFYSGKYGDYLSTEEIEFLERGKELPGSVPDFTRPPIEATAEELEAARKWAQNLP